MMILSANTISLRQLPMGALFYITARRRNLLPLLSIILPILPPPATAVRSRSRTGRRIYMPQYLTSPADY